MGSLHDSLFEIQKKSALAPDGLPWPPGYFDCMPKETFEQALANYGVRPNHYLKGWPVYSEAEMSRPEFRSAWSEEPPEVNSYWKARWEAGEEYPGPQNS